VSVHIRDVRLFRLKLVPPMLPNHDKQLGQQDHSREVPGLDRVVRHISFIALVTASGSGPGPGLTKVHHLFTGK
jgi:hypothetical protein